MNWQEERDATLCEARCVVVKVGSAVLSTGSELNLPVLDNLVNQLAVLSRQGRRVVLVSSGAVAAGRTALKKLPGEPAAVGLSGKQAAAAVGQGRLMHLYDNAFAERGILTAQVLLTRDDLKNRTRFLNIRNTFSELLNWGVIPVVNENDTVSVNELKFSDNDNLASLLINPVEADLFVNLTTIGGVLDANPLETPDATIMPCIEDVRALNLDTLCGGKTSVGTGGMYSKLLSAHRVAQLGVPPPSCPAANRMSSLACSRAKPSAHGYGPNSARFPAVNTGWRIRPIRRGRCTSTRARRMRSETTARASCPAALRKCTAALRRGRWCGSCMTAKRWAWA